MTPATTAAATTATTAITTASHDHALTCRDRTRTHPLPAPLPGASRTVAALTDCLAGWSRQIGALAQALHQDWAEVVRLHRRIEAQDRDTAGALSR